MYEEYLTQYQTYKGKFGPKVAIFLMVGIFYEMYDERSPEGQTKTSFSELVDLLGLKVSVKKGEGPSGPTYDGLVAGIPDYSVHKWAGKLTQLGWTVVLVEQVKNAAGKVTKRQVERILTPGTHIEAADANSMFLTFIYIAMKMNAAPSIAAAAIDLTTGKLHVFETTASGTEDAWTSNDMVQFMELYMPKEVIWSCEGPSYLVNELTESKIRSILACTSKTNFHQRAPLNSGAWLIPAFREEYLRNRCGLKSLLPTHASLNLVPGSQSESATISLLNALQELWPSLNDQPINLGSLMIYHWIPSSMMRLGENALVQLHMIVQDSTRQDVLGLFDKCATQMGHRGLRERLLKPSAEPTKIRELLAAVEHWTLKPAEYQTTIQRRLRTITDLDRLFRRIQQGTVTGTDLMNLDTSFKAAEWIARAEGVNETVAQIESIRTEVFNVFDLQKVYEADDDKSLFTKGLVPELDVIEGQISTQMDRISAWIAQIAKSAGNGLSTDTFKIEFRERSLVIKGPRAAIQLIKISGKLPPNTTAVTNKTTSYLESAELDQIYAIVCRLRETLKRAQSVALVQMGTVLTNSIFDSWNQVSEWIMSADVNLTLAKVAQDNGYVKPEVIDADASSLTIEGLRHPLLEAQDRKIPYVQHNVNLGHNNEQGWLLYGLNASGKSSLMRATGLAVLLAQAGSFVPATKIVLAPFQSIHTRIINTDNLWMGLSSFAVEMAEMRDIFRVAGPRSLVLGDELCSGTETTSATALVAAGLKGLLKRGARFLFATHLHGLSKIPEVAQDPELKIWHLHVEYDHQKDRLVYHRILKEGSGSSLYGLEVAKAMRIPPDILEDAIRFRKSLSGESELSESIGSSWNSAIVRRKCEECGLTEADNLEVHHIRQRASVNKLTGRLADGSSVHAAANLRVLCELCHDKHHAGKLDVAPMIQTSDGFETATTVIETTGTTMTGVTKKSKWSAEEQTTIETVCRQFSKLKNPALSKYLLNHHNIEISSVSLKNFRN